MAQTMQQPKAAARGTVMESIEAGYADFRNENTYWHHMEAGTLDQFHKAYEEAVAWVREEWLGMAIPCVIDGAEVRDEGSFTWTSPADQDLIVATYPKTTKATTIKAIEAARAGFSAWSKVPWAERAAILDKTADLFVRDFYKLCAVMTFETGKTRFEASIDVDEAIDFLRFYAKVMREMNGFKMTMGRPFPNERCTSVMRPYGVFGVICPFNFPVAISTGMTVAALVTGNTAVMKPSTKGTLAGYTCFKLMKEAGVPDHALQFVVGPDDPVAIEITTNTNIDGLAFTGSKNIGFKVQQKMAERDPGNPVICEMGGKNSITITKNADLDKAVEGAYRSAFGMQGQKCSACSRIFVDNSVKDEFLKRFVARIQDTVIAEPWKEEAFMGPVIEKAKFEWFQDWVKKIEDAGGTILAGGKPVEGLNGWYVHPTVATGVGTDHPIFNTELFVPFTTVWGVDSLDAALDLANSVEYGLTAGIFTEDDAEAEHFFDRIQSGVTYLNRKAGGSTAAVVNGQSFVGWKHSGSTGIGAGGRWYLMQFLREQSQTRCVD